MDLLNISVLSGSSWHYDKIDFLKDGLRIFENWYKINKDNKIVIDNIILITSKYIDIIEDIKYDKNIFLITNSERINEYNTKNINIINYDKYIINNIEYEKEKTKEYDKYNPKYGNQNVIYILNMLEEALNTKGLKNICVRFFGGIENMEYTETDENIDQYVLFFD